MEFWQLPVYNKCRQLAIQIVRSTQKTPKDIRHDYVRDLNIMVMTIMEKIAFANHADELRVEFIDEALKILKTVKLRVRILKDLNYIKPKGFSAITAKEENVVKQLQGWKNKTIENRNKEQQNK